MVFISFKECKINTNVKFVLKKRKKISNEFQVFLLKKKLANVYAKNCSNKIKNIFSKLNPIRLGPFAFCGALLSATYYALAS